MSLWEDKQLPLMCLAESSTDVFFNKFQKAVMPRNSLIIGTSVPKCFIYDMVKSIRQRFPDENWYGFCNSDCVPVKNIIEGYEDYQSLIYHRTEIPDWNNMSNRLVSQDVPEKMSEEIWKMRQEGMEDKKIARMLNRSTTPPPPGSSEWTQANIRQLFPDQGFVFFWGQDMYLFRADVVDEILEGHLREKDYILGTGAYDPRLSRYLIENYKSARVINKLYHKIHHSEWKTNDPDYIHNGGDVEISERWEHLETEFITLLCEQGQKDSIPKFIKYLVCKENPELAQKLMLI